MVRWIIVQPTAEKSSLERANYINGLLCELVRHPNDEQSKYLFNTIDHPDNGLTALEVIEDFYMALQKPEPLVPLVAELTGTVPDIAQAAQLTQMYMGQGVTFYNLLPQSVQTHSATQMREWGWFPQLDEMSEGAGI